MSSIHKLSNLQYFPFKTYKCGNPPAPKFSDFFLFMRGFLLTLIVLSLRVTVYTKNTFFNFMMSIFMPCSTKYLCVCLWSPLKEWDYSFAWFDTSSGTLLNWGLNILHYICLPLSHSEFIIHIEYYREIYIKNI